MEKWIQDHLPSIGQDLIESDCGSLSTALQALGERFGLDTVETETLVVLGFTTVMHGIQFISGLVKILGKFWGSWNGGQKQSPTQAAKAQT